MQVNPTLAQGLQVLTALTSDRLASSPKSDSGIATLLRAANGISIQASHVSKQASAAIGGALLGMNGQNGPRSDEALREAARQKAFASGSSWGVEQYDSIEDMPTYMRENAAKALARHEEEMARWEKVPGAHSWNEQAFHQTQIIMRQMEEAINGQWTFDAAGAPHLSEARLNGMHPAEKDFITGIASKLKAAVAALGESAAVTGDVVVHREDGTYGFGTFEVRDTSTGALYFSHDGNGKLQFHDANKGVVFSEFTASGDHWDWFDRAVYEDVFRQDYWSDAP
ncbi:hypothetical protein [Microvirga pakistanensis]|uniref:hypothetical protein n=1 Tax=Microvirga pakistanensis TaxID=1682650 RepID=UPI00106DBB4E|nr:hypothetical protein [Microvirga pakistanensis]